MLLGRWFYEQKEPVRENVRYRYSFKRFHNNWQPSDWSHRDVQKKWERLLIGKSSRAVLGLVLAQDEASFSSCLPQYAWRHNLRLQAHTRALACWVKKRRAWKTILLGHLWFQKILVQNQIGGRRLQIRRSFHKSASFRFVRWRDLHFN